MSLNATTNFRTRTDLLNAVGRAVEDSSTAGATLIGDYLDLAFEDLITSPHLPPLVRWHDAAVSVSAGAAYFHSPKHAREVIAITDTTTPWTLTPKDPYVFSIEDAGLAGGTGSPTSFTPVGDYGINTTISAGTAVEVLSSGSDTRQVTIRGILGGEYAQQSATLSGTTPVAVSSTWDDIFQFYVASTVNNRTITLRIASAGATLSTIGPNELDAVYHRYRLSAPAGQATSIRMLYKASPMALVSNSDMYPLPVGPYLYHAACARYQGEKRRLPEIARDHEARAENFKRQYMLELERQRGPTVALPYRRQTRPLAYLVVA